MTEIPNLHEQVFVGALLSEGNGKASAALDSFSGWLLAGFGASATLFVTQFESISKHIAAPIIREFLFLFFWSLGIGIIQKYVAVILAFHSQVSAIGRELGEKAAVKSIPLNFDIIFSEIEKATLPPMRWYAALSFAKVKKGDLVSNFRNYTRILQIQGFLVFAQAVLILVALFTIASGFHV